MDRDNETFCYVAKEPSCGCAGAVCVDSPEYAKDTAKFVAESVRDGFILERMTVAEFRKIPQFGCVKDTTISKCRAAKKGEPEQKELAV